MNPGLLFLVLLSIALSSASQLMLKVGMSSPGVQAALGDGVVAIVLAILTKTPFVVAGLFCFGLSALVWLLVLSKLEVSYAYPFVALGIVVTVVTGHLMLGEAMSVPQMVGIGTIVAGVVILAASR